MERKYCAGLVLYNPDIKRLNKSLSVIAPQVEKTVLVDNASANNKEVEELISHYDNVTLIRNAQNLGIATALNQICTYASENRSEWVLTLDQDTICSYDIIEKLSVYTDKDLIGILCPAVDYDELNIETKSFNEEVTETYACMSSGSFTNIEAWKKIGGFRDDYFIDFVDNEYCMRLRLNHYKILRVNSCIMHHQLGTMRAKRIWGVKRNVCVHAPIRYYYMTRNNLLFIWEYKSYLNIIKEYLKLGSILWYGLINTDERKRTLSYIKIGIKDANNGVLGELRESYKQ